MLCSAVLLDFSFLVRNTRDKVALKELIFKEMVTSFQFLHGLCGKNIYQYSNRSLNEQSNAICLNRKPKLK